jgi:hypothetical protein
MLLLLKMNFIVEFKMTWQCSLELHLIISNKYQVTHPNERPVTPKPIPMMQTLDLESVEKATGAGIWGSEISNLFTMIVGPQKSQKIP